MYIYYIYIIPFEAGGTGNVCIDITSYTMHAIYVPDISHQVVHKDAKRPSCVPALSMRPSY